ncbi:MAG TPA: beta-N-acetylhexosaminidase, partial [Arthrobacter sp.]|nr:beta-N-acetylhexosaminidase [Arthrobacter sp.]
MALFPRTRDSLHKTTLILAVAVSLAACTAVPAPAPLPPTQPSTPAGPLSPSQPTTSSPPSPSASPDAGARPLGWGPEQRDKDAAAAAVAAMTPEQKAGQVLMPFFAGQDAEGHAATIEALHLAGS